MKPGNMQNIMKQAQHMQTEMARVQEELKDEKIEVSVGGGAVKVVVTGDLVLSSVTIDAAAVDPDDVSMLEDLITAAVNEGIHQAQDVAGRKMSAVTGGLGLPGLM
ncbi:MAG: YbaB/EbfC family nucleoid-associated protein [Actinomycetia bacterium]|nr:YbaB/EbfC family nucleoid-associated protein [Actinomycetes bacterium]